MRRGLLIFLSLVLAWAGWSTVCAQDGFYVVPANKTVTKTGQTVSYATGDDGDLKRGASCPIPSLRFTDNKNGTVTDSLTGLIWTKNANAFGKRTWADALNDANNLKSGDYGLTDNSKAGDWRLPNVQELASLVDFGRWIPALPEGHPFTDVQSKEYWSSTTSLANSTYAWYNHFATGNLSTKAKTWLGYYVWCVRGGQ